MTNFNHSTRTQAKGARLFAISLIAFAAIAYAMGPTLAILAIKALAIILIWTALCSRFPTIAYFTYLFFSGFTAGLIGGSTNSGYGWRYGQRTRTYRRNIR